MHEPTNVIDTILARVIVQISGAPHDLPDLGDVQTIDLSSGTLGIGDPNRDGNVTISRDDVVTVWADDVEAAEATIDGAWAHYAARVRTVVPLTCGHDAEVPGPHGATTGRAWCVDCGESREVRR